MAFDYADPVLHTRLTAAVTANNKEAVCALIQEGLSVNLPDNHGWTPLHVACANDDRADCLEMMLQSGTANVNAVTHLGETPLMVSCKFNSFKALNLLLGQTKCSVNQASNENVTPLHIACCNTNLKFVKTLIDYGASLNIQDYNAYSPLHEAVLNGSFEICQYLLNHGANPCFKEYEGNYPFHFACQTGHLRNIILLLDATKQCNLVNMPNADGRTPVMMAISSRKLEVVEELLARGADPNVADNCEITALHLAAHSANFEIFDVIHRAMSSEAILKYCTFDVKRYFDDGVVGRRSVGSLVCLALDTEDLYFLKKVLNSKFDAAVLDCPVVHSQNCSNNTLSLLTPITFLLESKMSDLGESSLIFLQTLIDSGRLLNVISTSEVITYVHPICACLTGLNDCSLTLVMECIKMLLHNAVDPDDSGSSVLYSEMPSISDMPLPMDYACTRGCLEAVLLLLQHSNIVEPEHILKWLENALLVPPLKVRYIEGKDKIVNLLLPMAPYYRPKTLPLKSIPANSSTANLLGSPSICSLASHCRAVVRNQLHSEMYNSLLSFRQKLCLLQLPKPMLSFMSYEDV